MRWRGCQEKSEFYFNKVELPYYEILALLIWVNFRPWNSEEHGIG